jgi:predicted acetyltransferase
MEISTTSDIAAFLRPCFTALGYKPVHDFVEHTAKLVDAGRAHVVHDEGRIVGGAGAYSHSFAVPGGNVKAAAVFGVGVLPSHRRQGILTKLQDAQLADVHSRGEPIAYLWSSEGAIYGRFGYGLASQAMRIAVETKETRLRGAPIRNNEVRLIDRAEAYERLSPIYARIWKEHPGMFLRSENWWRRRLANPELYHAVCEDDAYALYLVKMDTSSGCHYGEVEVVEALARSVEGYRRIWHYLLSMDLIKRVNASYLPVDYPLILMIDDLRRINGKVRDGLWLRIVDVESAMRSRIFANESSVAIRVVDTQLPHNEGCWRIGSDGVRKVTTSPDLVIDVADLGSVYLGGFTFGDLQRSGRVHEQLYGAVRKADQVFSWDRRPWCPEAF